MRAHRRDTIVRPRPPRPDDPAPRIAVEDLTKTYGQVRAVDRVGFSVGDGEIFALLGPNGAGKTTIVEILEGYRTRDSGIVEVLGCDPATGGSAYRARIGVVLQAAGFEEEFTVRELIRLQCGLFPRRHPSRRPAADDRHARPTAGGQRSADHDQLPAVVSGRDAGDEHPAGDSWRPGTRRLPRPADGHVPAHAVGGGQSRRAPVLVVSHQGRPCLVSLAGESDWVRNVRAAGGRARLRRGRSQQVRLLELVPADRAPLIAAYLHRTQRAGGPPPRGWPGTTSVCPLIRP